MSCGVGCRRGSDPALLWLWRRPVATAPTQPLAWEPPYAAGAAQEIATTTKRQKTKKKKKKKVHLLIPLPTHKKLFNSGRPSSSWWQVQVFQISDFHLKAQFSSLATNAAHASHSCSRKYVKYPSAK